jgi:hypothetical protein
LAGLFDPTIGHMPLRASYRATWYPQEHVSGQDTSLGYFEHDFSLSFPLWQDSCNEWSASTHVRAEVFHTGAILPDTHQPFPDELWNVRFGTGYRHLFENGWIAGGNVSLGSASDKPFHSIDEILVGANGFLRIPQGEHNAWLFTLSYSTNSELPIPLPGVAYVWQPCPSFRMNVGLPFQLMVRPCDDLTLDFSYMLLHTIHARATYHAWGPVRVYGGFDWSNENYFLADRADSNERFFYYDMRVTGGVLVRLGPEAALDLSSGYVFDRYYFEGQHFSDSNFNRVDVGAGPFLSLQFQLRY